MDCPEQDEFPEKLDNGIPLLLFGLPFMVWSRFVVWLWLLGIPLRRHVDCSEWNSRTPIPYCERGMLGVSVAAAC